MTTKPIVVGVDGSEASLSALRWAAGEARRTGSVLRAVLAYEDDHPGDGPADRRSDARELARIRLADALGSVRADLAGVGHAAQVSAGRPAPVLLEAAERGVLLVVGNRGRTAVAGLLLGSVSLQVATHAAVPVAVVRNSAGLSDGSVVAGIDESPAADDVLATAFELAAAYNTRLVAVRAFELPVRWDGHGLTPPAYDPPGLARAHRGALTRVLQPWHEKYPAVPVETLVEQDGAAGLLVGLSRTARLVVVGSRGLGGFTGLLLGSVSRQVLQHAHSPVIVARRAA